MKWAVIHLERKKKKMPNEVQKTNQQAVAVTGGQKLQVQLLSELDKATESMGQSFSEYGKKCVVNAIAGLVIICKQQDIEIKDINPTLLRLSLQNIGYTELNFAANECYADLRKVYKEVEEDGKKTKVFDGYSVAFKVQGVGNEKLLRKYGVDVKTLRECWLVREGDEFILPSYNGLEMTPPIWKRKLENINNKVILVVYPVERKNGNVEYLMATRESVKANLVAHIRQNLLYKLFGEKRDQKYAELDKDAESMTFDELLASEKWRDSINPNWLASSSKEAMIIRKMQNNALKRYPKEYDNAAMKEAVKNMAEDYDESLEIKANKVIDADPIEKVEKEITEEQKKDAVPGFEVDDDGVVVKKEEQPKDNKANKVESNPPENAEVTAPAEEPKKVEKEPEPSKEPSYEDLI